MDKKLLKRTEMEEDITAMWAIIIAQFITIVALVVL